MGNVVCAVSIWRPNGRALSPIEGRNRSQLISRQAKFAHQCEQKSPTQLPGTWRRCSRRSVRPAAAEESQLEAGETTNRSSRSPRDPSTIVHELVAPTAPSLRASLRKNQDSRRGTQHTWTAVLPAPRRSHVLSSQPAPLRVVSPFPRAPPNLDRSAHSTPRVP